MTNDYRFDYKKFDELTVHELYAILAVREQVFSQEQNCRAVDIDGLDQKAVHVLCYHDKRLVGYTRILPASQDSVSFGRVLVVAVERGKGIAKQMMQAVLSYIRQHYAEYSVDISAQLYLQKFYEGFGFVAHGDVYDDGGIAHIGMRLQLT
jgi:ElaA protein